MPRVGLLSAGSRMLLLSDEISLAFAARLQRGERPDAHELKPIWRQLLHAPRWQPVMQQYHSMQRARALMVHVDDLLCAARRVERRAGCKSVKISVMQRPAR